MLVSYSNPLYVLLNLENIYLWCISPGSVNGKQTHYYSQSATGKPAELQPLPLHLLCSSSSSVPFAQEERSNTMIDIKHK